MATFEGFSRFIIRVIGFCILFAVVCDCRPANVPGTVTSTRITNIPKVFARIVNPCEVTPASRSGQQQGSTPAPTTSTASSNAAIMDFHLSMESALKATLEKLETLQSVDPGLPECNGISLDSLPMTPSLDHLNDAETNKQAYKTIIFLTTHFHLISLDRVIENAPPLCTQPTCRFQFCGNETATFANILEEVTLSLENILCTILTSATDEQTHTFREPLNSLQQTILYRYHASCSTLQTRDCLVIRETKEALAKFSRKYNQLVQSGEEFDNNI